MFRFLPKFNWLGSALCIFLVLSSTGLWSGPFLTGLSQAAASISNDVSILSSTTTNVTVALAGLALSVSRSSADAVQEMWNGVDVVQAVLEVRGARWVLCDSAVEDFFDSNVSTTLVNISQHQRSELKSVMAGISENLPEAMSAWNRFDTNSTFREFSYHVQKLPHGYLGVQYLSAHVVFEVVWSCPFWHAAGFDPTSQLESIRERIRGAIATIPEARWVPVPFDINAEPVRFEPTWTSRMRRSSSRWWQRSLARWNKYG